MDDDADSVRRMFKQCTAEGDHNVGELDGRIVAFYKDLRSAYPDCGPAVTTLPHTTTVLPTSTILHGCARAHRRFADGLPTVELPRTLDRAGMTDHLVAVCAWCRGGSSNPR